MQLSFDSHLATPVAPSNPDVDLVGQAQSGDHSAFTELWRRYSARMFNTILRITQNHEDAEDALQDSFLRAYMHLAEFRGQSKFSSWLTSIAINSALMCLRKRRSRPAVSIDSTDSDLPRDYREPESSALSAEQECIRREQMRNLGGAIARLRTPLRGILDVHLTQGDGVDQAAAAVGISLSAAKSRLMRAKNELRRAMTVRGQL